MNRQLPNADGRAPRILVRGVNWLGDAVMSTPALLRLRERHPGAHLALLTPEKLKDLWLRHPALNDVISFAPGEGVCSVGARLRRGQFEQALVLPNSPRSAMEPWLARIPQRIGYARPWRNWLLTRAIPTRPGHVPMRKRSPGEVRRLVGAVGAGSRTANRQSPIADAAAHQIHEYLHLAGILGANAGPVPPQLFVAPDEIAAAQKRHGLAEMKGPFFGLNPGAEYGPAKRWPAERFIAAAREIQKRTNCVWILFGGTRDESLAAEVEHELRDTKVGALNLAGKTSLRELMALLKCCEVLLTNDTGPMHMAAALGTPVVVPFGSTSPLLTGPGLPGDSRHRFLESNVPCSPCFLRECPIDFRCMKGIPVERITEAVLAVG